MVSDKNDSQGFYFLELVQLYKQNPNVRENFNFHHLPKLYIGFKNKCNVLKGFQ